MSELSITGFEAAALDALLAGDDRHLVVLRAAARAARQASRVGIGAGWMETDYRQAGIVCERPGVRIERLAEARSASSPQARRARAVHLR
jgi:hypothetical protein